MKRETAFIIEIVKIIINCIMIPMYFIKLFCDEAVLPGIDENGEEVIHKIYYYQSIFDKIAREGIAFLLWGAIAIIIVSITLSILSITIKENKALKIASHISFGVAIILFVVLLFIAVSIRYKY